MKQTRTVELGTGLFVLLGIAALFFLTTQTSNIKTYRAGEGYELVAFFDNIGSLRVRSPVAVSGVTIGRVSKIDYDPERLEAVVHMHIESRYDQFPTDSDATILTSGLIGGQYVSLTPGGMDEFLGDGDVIEFTQSALVLELLIGKYLVNMGKESNE